MIPIPDEILKPFDAVMEKKSIPSQLRPDYRKWLRYFLDFHAKYSPPDSRSDQVRLFIQKLKSKGQSQQQLGQAAQAISFFFTTQSKGISGKQESGELMRLPIPTLPLPLKGREYAASSPSVRDKKTAPRPGRRYDEIQTLLGHADIRTTMIYPVRRENRFLTFTGKAYIASLQYSIPIC